MQKICALILAIYSSHSLAAGVSPFYDFASTTVLPKGIRSLSFKTIGTAPSNRLGNDGASAPLGAALTQDVTFQALIDGKPNPEDRDTAFAEAQKAELKAFLENNGFSTEDLAGKTTAEINIVAAIVTPVLAYGMSNNWSLGLAVPVYQYRSSVRTGFVANKNIDKIAQILKEKGMTEELVTLEESLENPVQAKMAKNVYVPPRSMNKTMLGDIKLVSKYRFYRQELIELVAYNELTLPTGNAPDAYKALDLTSGDGQIDLNLGLISAIQVSDGFRFISQLGYIFELPDKLERRIPEDSGSRITPDMDPNTRRDIGDQAYAQFVGEYVPYTGFALNAAYGFKYKAKDRYSGAKFAMNRYKFLETETRQNIHTAQAGASYSTIDLYRAKKFAVPLKAGLNYTHVLAGKNVMDASVYAFELSMFF